MTFSGRQSMKMVVIILLVVLGGIYVAYANKSQQTEALRGEITTISAEVDSRDKQIEEQKNELDALQQQLIDLKKREASLREEVSRGEARAMNMIITAYDLSIASCGKGINDPAYGLTASGINLAGHTLESARAIAVDPSVIPLGSKVRIKFKNPKMQQYNGIYTAVDTGGAIKGNRIDLFFGDFRSHRPAAAALNFGRQEAKVIVL